MVANEFREPYSTMPCLPETLLCGDDQANAGNGHLRSRWYCAGPKGTGVVQLDPQKGPVAPAPLNLERAAYLGMSPGMRAAYPCRLPQKLSTTVLEVAMSLFTLLA